MPENITKVLDLLMSFRVEGDEEAIKSITAAEKTVQQRLREIKEQARIDEAAGKKRTQAELKQYYQDSYSDLNKRYVAEAEILKRTKEEYHVTYKGIADAIANKTRTILDLSAKEKEAFTQYEENVTKVETKLNKLIEVKKVLAAFGPAFPEPTTPEEERKAVIGQKMGGVATSITGDVLKGLGIYQVLSMGVQEVTRFAKDSMQQIIDMNRKSVEIAAARSGAIDIEQMKRIIPSLAHLKFFGVDEAAGYKIAEKYMSVPKPLLSSGDIGGPEGLVVKTALLSKAFTVATDTIQTQFITQMTRLGTNWNQLETKFFDLIDFADSIQMEHQKFFGFVNQYMESMKFYNLDEKQAAETILRYSKELEKGLISIEAISKIGKAGEEMSTGQIAMMMEKIGPTLTGFKTTEVSPEDLRNPLVAEQFFKKWATGQYTGVEKFDDESFIKKVKTVVSDDLAKQAIPGGASPEMVDAITMRFLEAFKVLSGSKLEQAVQYYKEPTTEERYGLAGGRAETKAMLNLGVMYDLNKGVMNLDLMANNINAFIKTLGSEQKDILATKDQRRMMEVLAQLGKRLSVEQQQSLTNQKLGELVAFVLTEQDTRENPKGLLDRLASAANKFGNFGLGPDPYAMDLPGMTGKAIDKFLNIDKLEINIDREVSRIRAMSDSELDKFLEDKIISKLHTRIKKEILDKLNASAWK